MFDSSLTQLVPFLLAAAFNLAVAVLIVRGIYYPVTRDRKYVPSFLAFNMMVFFILSLLGSVELSVGIGFGLFAIFSVLNYRTDEMPMREMTYLFVLLALPVMNSFLGADANLVPILVANGVIVALMFVLERGWGFRFEASQRLVYDTVELLAPDRRDELLADLRRRTGLPVTRVEIGRIDLLRDSAEITMSYEQPKAPERQAAVPDGGAPALYAPAERSALWPRHG
jgi:hypothetical protein